MLSQLIEQHAALQKQLQNQGQALLAQEFNKFFADNPLAKAIVWEQYAPHFNDGEPCEFNVYERRLLVHQDQLSPQLREQLGTSYGSDDDLDGYLWECFASAVRRKSLMERYGSDNYPWVTESKVVAEFETLDRLLDDVPDSVYRSVFRPDCRVVAKPGKFEILDYDHD